MRQKYAARIFAVLHVCLLVPSDPGWHEGPGQANALDYAARIRKVAEDACVHCPNRLVPRQSWQIGHKAIF